MTTQPHRTPQRRPLALVTGASGGIGEAIARELAAHGHDLVLTARSQGKLQALAEELRVKHVVRTYVLGADLTNPEAPGQLVAGLQELDLQVDVLVNNAGVATYGEFHDADLASQQGMLQMNVLALTELTHRLLPGMLTRRSGHVMNVASTAAFMPGPMMTVYYASKAYVLSFSEGLAEELRGTGVTVTALCPGPVETGFQARAQMQDSRLLRTQASFKGIMDATTVARDGVHAMLKGQRVTIPGTINQLQALTPRFVPRAVLPGILKRLQGRAH